MFRSLAAFAMHGSVSPTVHGPCLKIVTESFLLSPQALIALGWHNGQHMG